MTENENLEKQIADDLSAVLKEAKEMGCKEVAYFRHIPLQNVETVVNALYEIKQYRAIGTVEDVKELARNERNKAIDDVFEFLKNKRDKKHLKVNLDDLEIRIYKEQLKGGAE